MALALTAFRAGGIGIQGPSRQRGYQTLGFAITGTTADVTLDFGNYTGTLWTALVATQEGKDILALVKTIMANASSLHDVNSEQLLKRVKVASVSAAGQYQITTITNHLPTIVVNAADGETLWQITLLIALNNGISPMISEYSANNT